MLFDIGYLDGVRVFCEFSSYLLLGISITIFQSFGYNQIVNYDGQFTNLISIKANSYDFLWLLIILFSHIGMKSSKIYHV